MIRIPVSVCGDYWSNKQIVKEKLDSVTTNEPIALDLLAEGPSLYSLGVVDMVLNFLEKTNRGVSTVAVDHWSNTVEPIPFQRLNSEYLSHFFWLSNTYIDCVINERSADFLFGYFVGRRTVPRCVMLKEIHHAYAEKFLLSLMPTTADIIFSDLDPLADWIDPNDFHAWFRSMSIPSLDNFSVLDQFRGNNNTHCSILQWYPKFDIELVSETYTHGNTFFVTEKTVRPLVAGKSLIVYGPQNYLARLRELGFQTWSGVWDESYDNLTGPARWHAIQKIIDDLLLKDQHQLYSQCQPIVQHNQQHAKYLIEKYRPL
jgi:hypothetical protein